MSLQCSIAPMPLTGQLTRLQQQTGLRGGLTCSPDHVLPQVLGKFLLQIQQRNQAVAQQPAEKSHQQKRQRSQPPCCPHICSPPRFGKVQPAARVSATRSLCRETPVF